MTTKRCKYLTSEYGYVGHQFAVGTTVVTCSAKPEECPKNRLKCSIGQACWQVKLKPIQTPINDMFKTF